MKLSFMNVVKGFYVHAAVRLQSALVRSVRQRKNGAFHNNSEIFAPKSLNAKTETKRSPTETKRSHGSSGWGRGGRATYPVGACPAEASRGGREGQGPRATTKGCRDIIGFLEKCSEAILHHFRSCYT